jgi:ABC-type polysaccharide/polyol phosphate transport system ATPase subunit
MSFIECKRVNLKYPIRENSGMTFKEFVLHGIFRKERAKVREIHALRDVSVNVRKGERVGIIGHNGAGKSTLLRVMAGVYPVASGSVRVEGSISSLFDLMVGFESEASGWQNIYYRSYLQGETPTSIKAKMADIAEFCELGEALDLPIRCYSSGMLMRLAFSIATSSDPEILLIDEVFGTGDYAFQKKARERMRDLITRAHIVVMVGHNLSFLEEFCERVLWMDDGEIRRDGPAKETIAAYIEFMEQKRARRAARMEAA